MVEAIPYCNEIVVAINGIITTKISLQYMIFIATKIFVVKTYYHRVYCNKNFVATNLFFLVVKLTLDSIIYRILKLTFELYMRIMKFNFFATKDVNKK